MRAAGDFIWILVLSLCSSTMSPWVLADLIPEQDSFGADVLQGYSNSYALIIEISDYPPGPWTDLDSIPAELDEVERLLREQDVSSITRLRNPDISRMRAGFESFIREYGTEKEARLIVFYAGHGYTAADGSAYLVPSTRADPHKDLATFSAEALDMKQVTAWARQIESKHVLFLFDSCFSGSIFLQRSAHEARNWISKLTRAPVRYFITAGSAHETVPARSELVPELIQAVRYGKADMNSDGYVTSGELGLFLRESIMKRSAQTPQHGPLRDGKYDGGEVVFKVPHYPEEWMKTSTLAQVSSPDASSTTGDDTVTVTASNDFQDGGKPLPNTPLKLSLVEDSPTDTVLSHRFEKFALRKITETVRQEVYPSSRTASSAISNSLIWGSRTIPWAGLLGSAYERTRPWVGSGADRPYGRSSYNSITVQ